MQACSFFALYNLVSHEKEKKNALLDVPEELSKKFEKEVFIWIFLRRCVALDSAVRYERETPIFFICFYCWKRAGIDVYQTVGSSYF